MYSKYNNKQRKKKCVVQRSYLYCYYNRFCLWRSSNGKEKNSLNAVRVKWSVKRSTKEVNNISCRVVMLSYFFSAVSPSSLSLFVTTVIITARGIRRVYVYSYGQQSASMSPIVQHHPILYNATCVYGAYIRQISVPYIMYTSIYVCIIIVAR